MSRASESPFAVEGYLSTEDRSLVLTIYGDYSTAVVTINSVSLGKKDEYLLTSQTHVSLPLSEYSGNVDVVVMIDGKFRFIGSITI